MWDVAEAARLREQMETFSDEQVRDVLLALQPSGGRESANPLLVGLLIGLRKISVAAAERFPHISRAEGAGELVRVGESW
jgi:hypothetical protein